MTMMKMRMGLGSKMGMGIRAVVRMSMLSTSLRMSAGTKYQATANSAADAASSTIAGFTATTNIDT